jgi:hypothetical protein
MAGTYRTSINGAKGKKDIRNDAARAASLR